MVENGRMQLTVIEASRPRAGALLEVWKYRELLGFLVWRDILVRYRQTILGVAWAALQPLALLLAFGLLSRKVPVLAPQGIPYPVFAFCGLVMWSFFAQGVVGATDTLTGNAGLLSKVYFPRLVLPLARVVSYAPDLAVAAAILVVLLIVYPSPIAITSLLCPFFFLLAIATTLATGILTSALTVRYRDLRHAVPFLVQLGIFATPVAYSTSTLVDPRWQWLYGLNPMTGAIEGFRWALLNVPPPSLFTVGLSIVMDGLLVILSLAYFRRAERLIVDVI